MNRHMKRGLSLALAFLLLLALMSGASAADAEAQEAAERLNALGLFSGTGTDENGEPIFELDRSPNRYEAITMLVRLLGKEAEANAGTWEYPFTDVMDWAKPYVGYAYAHKLTSGTSETTFSGSEPVSATQYITFVLRALGYSSDTDFRWDRAWELSDSLGFTDGRYGENGGVFLRGDVVIVSASALDTMPKGAEYTLLDALIAAGAVKASEPETPEEPEEKPLQIQRSGWTVGEVRPVAYGYHNPPMYPESYVDIRSFTAQLMNNGVFSFTMVYSMGVVQPILIFDPPSGNVFKIESKSLGTGATEVLEFELSAADLTATDSVTILMNKDPYQFFAFFDTVQFRNELMNCGFSLSGGKAVGQAKSLTFDESIYDWTGDTMRVSGITAQQLDNGYTRFTVEYVAPWNMIVNVSLGLQKEDAWKQVFYLTGYTEASAEKQYLYLDVLDTDLGPEGSMMFGFGGHGDGENYNYTAYFSTDQLS